MSDGTGLKLVSLFRNDLINVFDSFIRFREPLGAIFFWQSYVDDERRIHSLWNSTFGSN